MTRQPNRLLLRPTARNDLSAPGPRRDAIPDAGSDLLSDVFRGVRLTGSMFFLVKAATPWISRAPRAEVFARAVLPGAQHLISYHLLTEGTCWGGIEGEAPHRMAAGDILVIPHGAPYFLANPATTPSACSDADALSFFRSMAAGELPAIVTEGGNGPESTCFICGFLGCDPRPFNPILASLPPLLLLRRAAPAGTPLRHLVDLALAEFHEQRAGAREVQLRLSELIFIAAIRRHVEAMPDRGEGWLAGLREPLVMRVLTLLHAQPSRNWTLEALAEETGTSRSVLAARFTEVVGQPPIRYLTAWRMQLAIRLLADQGSKVRAVGEAVGYDSEAAFSRAFTRLVGSNPIAWRASVRKHA